MILADALARPFRSIHWDVERVVGVRTAARNFQRRVAQVFARQVVQPVTLDDGVLPEGADELTRLGAGNRRRT